MPRPLMALTSTVSTSAANGGPKLESPKGPCQARVPFPFSSSRKRGGSRYLATSLAVISCGLPRLRLFANLRQTEASSLQIAHTGLAGVFPGDLLPIVFFVDFYESAFRPVSLTVFARGADPRSRLFPAMVQPGNDPMRSRRGPRRLAVQINMTSASKGTLEVVIAEKCCSVPGSRQASSEYVADGRLRKIVAQLVHFIEQER